MSVLQRKHCSHTSSVCRCVCTSCCACSSLRLAAFFFCLRSSYRLRMASTSSCVRYLGGTGSTLRVGCSGGNVATGAGAGADSALLEALACALSLAFSFLRSNALARIRSRCARCFSLTCRFFLTGLPVWKMLSCSGGGEPGYGGFAP